MSHKDVVFELYYQGHPVICYTKYVLFTNILSNWLLPILLMKNSIYLASLYLTFVHLTGSFLLMHFIYLARYHSFIFKGIVAQCMLSASEMWLLYDRLSVIDYQLYFTLH